MSVQATLVIEFGEGADSGALVVVELDSELNNQQTQFAPGTEVWWWLHHDSSLRLGSVICSAGTTIESGTATRTRTEDLTFTDQERTAQLSCVPSSPPTFSWFGNQGAGVTVNGRNVSVTGGLPCTGAAAYPIQVRLFRYIPPPMTLGPDETFRVVIVVTMEAA